LCITATIDLKWKRGARSVGMKFRNRNKCQYDIPAYTVQFRALHESSMSQAQSQICASLQRTCHRDVQFDSTGTRPHFTGIKNIVYKESKLGSYFSENDQVHIPTQHYAVSVQYFRARTVQFANNYLVHNSLLCGSLAIVIITRMWTRGPWN
jgi:hypothetical protein